MKTVQFRKNILRVIISPLIIGVLFASARAGDLFHSSRIGSTDFLHGDTSPGNEVIIVAIDNTSVDQYGSWPWPHAIHAQLIENLGQARVVGIDILFDEIDNPSFVDAIKTSNNVILALIGVLPERAEPGIISSHALLASPSDLQSAAIGEGVVNTVFDTDGITRKVPLLIQQSGQNKEAMSLQLIRHYLGLPNGSPAKLDAGFVQIGSLRIPVDQWSRMIIHFAGEPKTFNFVSYADVLSGAVHPDVFKNKIVLVGQMNLTNGVDLHDVPTSRGNSKMSGVEIQANIIHTILHQHFLREQALITDIMVIIIMSLLGGLMLSRFHFWWGIPSVLLVEGGYLLYSFSMFDQGVLPNIFYASLSLIVSYIAAIAIDNISLFSDLKRNHIKLTKTYDTTLQGWARALELRDFETKGHTMRVTHMTVGLARSMGFSEDELIHIRRGAILHDIGKIGIPDSILLKPGKLTEDEWKIMRQHPHYGYEMLLPISFLKPALDIVIYHHEKWDGCGYPKALKGEDIPLAARIFSVVDVWDALTSDRPYHEALSKEKALAIIRKGSGTHFDPDAVAAFLKYVSKEPSTHKYDVANQKSLL